MPQGRTILSERKKVFAEHYLQNFNATKSAKLAGYSEKTAYSQGQRLLKDVEVKKVIEKAKEKAHNERIMSLQDLLEFWTSTAKGHEAGDFKDRLKASEYLGRTMAAFKDKVEVTGGLKVLRLDKDEQLL